MFSKLTTQQARAAILATVFLIGGTELASAQSGRSRTAKGADRTVLVETFVSQGCNLCPQAETLISKLQKEYGPDRVAVVSYHVDYFNEPWKDPFSDPDYSRREYQYSTIYDREHKQNDPNYLYLTPLVIVDGKTPMVGSNKEAHQVATDAIRAGLSERPAATLNLTLALESGDGPRDLTVEVATTDPRSPLAGREVLVEVVTVEDGLSTDVKSGELAGQTYRSNNVARAFVAKPVRLGRDGKPESLQFPIKLAKGLDPARCRLVALVQDEENGRVYQAGSVAWRAATSAETVDASQATAPSRDR